MAAPVLLVGGWATGAALQPAGYDPVRDTISSLAARGATDRWVMTAALIGVGLCYLLIAFGLRPAAAPGRTALALGGITTLSVAYFPEPAHGSSVAHAISATVAFVSLALWPMLAHRVKSGLLLASGPSLAASAILAALVVWFAFELGGGQIGLAERTAATAQALWPLLVVVSSRRTAGA